MRIEENTQYNYESYTSETQESVKEVFYYSTQIIEMRNLLDEIKKETSKLRNITITEEDKNNIKQAIKAFDARMQATVYYTLKNLDSYQNHGWKELLEEGENKDE